MNIKPCQHVIEKLFVIPDKAGNVVPFHLNNIQKDFHDKRSGRDDILKFRQGGCTSFIMAWFLVECMNSYTRAVLVAHDKEHTEKLLQRCHFFLSTLRGPKPKLKKANEQEIVFEKTHSSFFIGTAGSRQFGRSDTITHLHCSEVAFWKNAKDLVTGLFQAVPHSTGIIVKECTANGFGTWHHKQYMKATQGEGRFQALFYPWYIFEEYQSVAPHNFEPTMDELVLVEKYNLTHNQLQWRREKLYDDFDGLVELFNQEYPSTIEEAFMMSGGSLFSNARRLEDKRWERVSCNYAGKLHILTNHPAEGYHYVFGVDVAGGTGGGDYSTVFGVCVETGEQVLEYKTNTLSPPEFYLMIDEYGKKYHEALLVVESNQHGLSVLSLLKDTYPTIRIYKEYKQKRVGSIMRPFAHYGFKTTSVSKPFIVGLVQQYLREDRIVLYGLDTLNQLLEYSEVVTPSGTSRFEGPEDDLVIGLAMACIGMQKEQKRLVTIPRVCAIEPVPFNVVTFDDIMSRIKKPTNKWFAPQHNEERKASIN